MSCNKVFWAFLAVSAVFMVALAFTEDFIQQLLVKATYVLILYFVLERREARKERK